MVIVCYILYIDIYLYPFKRLKVRGFGKRLKVRGFRDFGKRLKVRGFRGFGASGTSGNA
jgi:hypothetical protein